jgi:RNA polymerase sigma-54 factor
MSLVQNQGLKQTQKLSAQQIQLVNILALPTAALEQCITKEMALNPALEFDNNMDDYENDLSEDSDSEAEDAVSEGILGDDYDYVDYMDRDSLDDYKYEANNCSGEEEKNKDNFTTGKNDYTHYLLGQLDFLNLTEKEKSIANFIINNLDEDGYLRRDLGDLADELAFAEKVMAETIDFEMVRQKIHLLEPLGVAAFDLQECLLIQLKNKKQKTKDTFNAINIIAKFIKALGEQKLDEIKLALNISHEELEDAMAEIKTLNPIPAGSMKENDFSASTIEPDFTVTVDNNRVQLKLNPASYAPLKISEDYVDMLQTYSAAKDKKMREAGNFIKSKVDTAKWFIEALQQREQMMVLVAKAVVNHQQQYFITGNELDLKPLILKDIASIIGSDISTVSRIVNTKYVQTNFGVILMKRLFIEGLSSAQGEMISTLEVKKILKEFIEAEDKHKPLSDEQIAKELSVKNFTIARRTIAKYREEMNIPSKNFRKAA